ncbi:hypothetical protein [Stieleria neptunia]|uniref:hypothetical protein n=1 Tax=Stieleria neptunia TaxID=2527979 RepID=UPI0011A4E252|nr:hypothetical protein [Stieleria neptunia]
MGLTIRVIFVGMILAKEKDSLIATVGDSNEWAPEGRAATLPDGSMQHERQLWTPPAFALPVSGGILER